MMVQRWMQLCAAMVFFTVCTHAQNIVAKPGAGAVPLVTAQGAAIIYVDEKDNALTNIAAGLLQRDIQSVTGKQPKLVHGITAAPVMIIIGTLGQSQLVDALVANGKLTTGNMAGQWEAYTMQTVQQPVKGVALALVIAGADRRGTAYGVFELSRQLGVSPWYYWADVPAKQQQQVYFKGTMTDAPKVKYRGIFINDEAPALSGWSKATFGGFNHKFYEKVFELILRLKGNYLWPAMWGSAFNDDDTLNPVVADRYGIVMGTSHHEPLVRAHDEWRRYGTGKWNYDSNATNLRAFWTRGIERMGNRENIVSIGMRGDGDEPMTRGTATALLERIVKDQREIIAQTTGKPASATPQLWALYKEVQDYYDKGMRVPDDVTLLLCDDNWGNIRKLPSANEKKHPGGYGIYYHFDYVGGPRNYKWINTNQIERTWEQMHLAYRHGVDKIWIVNVGDIKPMELPTQFFLDYAWNPEAITAKDLPAYYTQWATQQFGPANAVETGKILAAYTKFNSRRKPELLAPDTYSFHYNEVDEVVRDYNALAEKAQKIYNQLPANKKDAYYQLVLHPVTASANLNALYSAVAYNRLLAKEKLTDANYFADEAKRLYRKDSLITRYYNDTLAGGKWTHMMDQTHIGYTYWQQPPFNRMPEVKYVSAAEAESASRSTQVAPPVVAPHKMVGPAPSKDNVFAEKNGYVSIEAPNYTRAVAGQGYQWQTIPNLGRTLGAVTALPVAGNTVSLNGNSPHLQYNVHFTTADTVKVKLLFSPTLPFNNDGLKYAISIDNEAPQVVNLHEGFNDRVWNGWVANNIVEKESRHLPGAPGKHTIKFWLIDPAVVLQKILVDAGGLQPSYLGPGETRTPLQTKTNTSKK